MRLMTGGREESNKEIGSRQSEFNLMYFMENNIWFESEAQQLMKEKNASDSLIKYWTKDCISSLIFIEPRITNKTLETERSIRG